MKKNGILHRDLARVVASLGHGDLVVIGDAGLPVPQGVTCIDLAVTHGVPTFQQVFAAILSEMQVESAFIATEAEEQVIAWTASVNPARCTHDELKTRSQRAVAVVRTGELTPYANIGLIAGVTF